MRGAGSVFGQGAAIFSVPRSVLCHGQGCPVLVPGACVASGSWAVRSRNEIDLAAPELLVLICSCFQESCGFAIFFFFKASLAPSLLYLSPVPTRRAQAQVSASINCPIFPQQLYNEAVLKIGREGSAWARGPSGCGGESSSRAAAMIGVCKCNQP